MWKKKSKGNRNGRAERTDTGGNFRGDGRSSEGLESREISLEDSFEKYKEGMALLKAAGEKIDTVEKAMLVLNDQGEADEF